MVAFLVAEQKLSAVSEWEAERHAQVRLEADQRRAEQRLEGARALARMRDRGETVADIAQLGGCSVKLVRRYLKELQAAGPVSVAASGNGSQALGSAGAAAVGVVSQALGGGGEGNADEVESSTAAAGIGSVVWRDSFRRLGRAPAVALSVDPKAHAAEVARFRSKIVAGPGEGDCSIWIGSITLVSLGIPDSVATGPRHIDR
jgi:hypothetical protein